MQLVSLCLLEAGCMGILPVSLQIKTIDDCFRLKDCTATSLGFKVYITYLPVHGTPALFGVIRDNEVTNQ